MLSEQAATGPVTTFVVIVLYYCSVFIEYLMAELIAVVHKYTRSGNGSSHSASVHLNFVSVGWFDVRPYTYIHQPLCINTRFSPKP